MAKKSTIPGVIGPTETFWTTSKSGPKSIEEKRATVIQGIERYRSGEARSIRLESTDMKGSPVIRVLYGTVPLAIFDGKTAAIIDPAADRNKLWNAIIAKFNDGEYDEEIERVAHGMLNSIRESRKRQ